MAISSSLRILVIDDDAEIRQTLHLILQNIGFKTIKMSPNGKDAIEYIDAQLKDGLSLPQFIMCDYDMPGMTGVSVFQSLKDRGGEAVKIPFLLISGMSDKNFILEARDIGIKYILLKPFTQQTLVKEMARILN